MKPNIAWESWIFNFFFIFTFSQIVSASQSEKTCAVLYSGQNYADNKLNFLENQQISLFEDYYVNSKEIWNVTGSFKIAKGCTFIACNESYFDGNCKAFEADVPHVSEEFKTMGSANCSCETDCKCEGIKLRKAECARAYIDKGCNSCNAYYTDFRTKKPFIGDAFKSKIASLVVRPGCQIELFDEEDYDGNSEIVEGVAEEWTKVINSYECTCNPEAEVSQNITKIRPPNYPAMITMPDSPDEIMAMLNDKDRHPGLMMALQSVKNKRSPKNAYILLLGLTGAGKSSAINLLFDNPNVTKVGDEISTTTNIHEFRIPVAVDELGISNSELRVIDTPGLGDTRGLENDAKFLATLDDYLSSHEELNKYIPNVVLVFAKFNDNRFTGEGASFVKMLRGIDLFRDRLTDKGFSNVIFVLSHYMSETNDMTRRPTKRLNAIKKTIEDFSLFPKPITITVAENKGKEEDLPMLNGYFKLPNGDFYPRNLFDKIQQATTSGADPIGEAIIRTAFKNSDDFKINASSFSLVESKHGKVVKYLGILSAANYKFDDTEVSRALETAYESMDVGIKRKFPDALPYLQRSFNIRNIHLKTNVPRTTVDIVKLLKEIRQTEANIFLMEKAFDLRMPELKENLVTGYGYNVIDDTTLVNTPFKFGAKTISDIGYLIPSVLTCKVEKSIENVYETFASKAAYVDFRLQKLNIQGSVPTDVFNGAVKPGCNVLDVSSNITAAVEGHVFTAIREHRIFELVLNDRLDLTKEFLSAVKSLPTYNESDHEGIEIWKNFFKTFGTHVVKSAHGGGSIEIQLTSTEPLSPAISEAMFSIVQFAEDVSIGRINGLSLDTNGTQYTLKFKGGDFKYHTSTLSGMSLTEAAHVLENWKESLQYSPVMLQSDMKLLPISEVAKKVGQNISAEIQRAAMALFNSTLRYVPPQRINLPPVARENTAELGSGGNGQLSLVFQQMMEESRKSSERFELMIAQMNKDAAEREIQRQKDREEERKWQRERQAKMDDQMREDREREKDRQALLERQRIFAEKEAAIKMEDERRRQEERDMVRQQEQEEQRRQYMRQIQELANRPPVVIERGGGGCLKKGTLISMADGSHLAIEEVKVGDFVLDINLEPTLVLGVSAWFLEDQVFYGFEEDKEFFTGTHMFVGSEGFHVVDKPHLLEVNPLMSYLNVTEFPKEKRFNMNAFDSGSGVTNKMVRLTQEGVKYPRDTLVYFIQVESQTGTYLANNYVCRHEMPPFEKWPKTIATIFLAMTDSKVQFMKDVPYSSENMEIIHKLIGNIHDGVMMRLSTFSFPPEQDSSEEFGLESFDVQETMKEIMERDTFANLAIGIYASMGPILAEVMESEHAPKIQNLVVGTIVNEIIKYQDNTSV